MRRLELLTPYMRNPGAREALAKLLSWDFDKVIVAHGACVEGDAKPFVETAFRWLGA